MIEVSAEGNAARIEVPRPLLPNDPSVSNFVRFLDSRTALELPSESVDNAVEELLMRAEKVR